jgi:hypothetical protein
MAICTIIHDPDRTQQQHERITAHVRGSGPVPPQGCRLVLLGRERAITVFDSSEQRNQFFAERLGPAYEAAGGSLHEVACTQFDVELLVAGDLAGIAPQPV